MDRRTFLLMAKATGLASLMPLKFALAAKQMVGRIRPGDDNWPTKKDWVALATKLNGKLESSKSAQKTVLAEMGGKVTKQVEEKLTNPFFLQDFSGSTQSLGWLDGWKSAESAMVGIPTNAQDVSELVKFAGKHQLRLVIKGGGHSYYGQSNAPDSLLVWTRDLKGIELHDNFVPQNGDPSKGQPAVTVASGEKFIDLYGKVVVEEGRYVQGGGCTSVGVGGHVQGGGFGHFSKYGGMTAANLLEAEIVVGNGDIVIANAYQNSDLFWALKGGGAGWGITTRLTLATRELPEYFGFIGFALRADNEEKYRQLVGDVMAFTKEHLINPQWGEQIHFGPKNSVYVKMTNINMLADDVRKLWQPILSYAQQDGFEFIEDPVIYETPAQKWWDLGYRKKEFPETIVLDQDSSKPGQRFFWNGDNGETNVFWAGYESAWLTTKLLERDQMEKFVDVVVRAARDYRLAFHFQKGLAGANKERLQEAANTPVHPSLLESFALLLVAGAQQNVFDDIPGHQLDEAALRDKARRIRKVYEIFRTIEPDTGSYSAEMSFHEEDWQQKAWGDNYSKLLTIKNKYDPDGLFMGHHQVGSEFWTEDGFTRKA